MSSLAASACIAPAIPPAIEFAPVAVMAVGDYEVVLHGPGSGLWRQGVRLGSSMLVWPCSAVADGAEIGGWMLRYPESATLLSVEVRSLMAFGPGWLGGCLLARGYAIGGPDCARGVSGFLWQTWLQRLAVTPQGVLPAGSAEAARALKDHPVWRQEVAHVHA